MVNQVIAGAIVLAFLLAIVSACVYLSDSDAEKASGQSSPLTPEQKTMAQSITLMPDEKDDIPLTEDTDLAAFARDEMNRLRIFQAELEGTKSGEPVFVYSLNEKRYDYYLIPFKRDSNITVIAQVAVKGNTADFSSAYPPPLKTRNVVQPTLEEAKEFISESGYSGNWSARLVWKPCEQTQSPTCPVWEFKQEDGKKMYVGYCPFDEKIHIYDELTDKMVMG